MEWKAQYDKKKKKPDDKTGQQFQTTSDHKGRLNGKAQTAQLTHLFHSQRYDGAF